MTVRGTLRRPHAAPVRQSSGHRKRLGSRPRAGRAGGVPAALAAAVLAAALAGCGIRSTDGPINAGEPAKRPAPGTATTAPVAQHQIYLIREGRPQPVPRGDAVDIQVPAPGATRIAAPGDPLRMSLIDRLLRELAKGPSSAEAAQGWTTAVPAGGIGLAEPQPGDPADLVRLDVDNVAALNPLALGQIVCTLQRAAKTEGLPLAGRTGPARAEQCAAYQKAPAAAPSTAKGTG